MGITTESTTTAKTFDRYTQLAYARHLQDAHDIPQPIAVRLSYGEALQLCYDDQAQDVEDWRP